MLLVDIKRDHCLFEEFLCRKIIHKIPKLYRTSNLNDIQNRKTLPQQGTPPISDNLKVEVSDNALFIEEIYHAYTDCIEVATCPCSLIFQMSMKYIE